ncbi:hypothetical protein D3C74_226090 [compost metagenome]
MDLWIELIRMKGKMHHAGIAGDGKLSNTAFAVYFGSPDYRGRRRPGEISELTGGGVYPGTDRKTSDFRRAPGQTSSVPSG